MGIKGLIPFLEKSSRQVNISQYSGCTVAIDAYCWLHKGTFGCADKLARGEKTDAYVSYCMKYVNMLLSHNIKPILVFDGRHLPAKADTEKKRRETRETNRRRAAELLRQDKPNEARTFLQRCVDVTHMMAVELMRECRSYNVDCITAPYEADAQLAYLNLNGIADIVITEDSDLLLFGCNRVMFKLDLAGTGLLVEQDRLYLAMGLSQGIFTMDKFRHMCILSGCDYLPSLPQIGLMKASRFVKSTVDPDIHRALSRLGSHLNMNITVPLEYRDRFLEADAMFKHQPVFDPLTRQLVPLTPLPPGVPPPPLLTREPLTSSQLVQLAYGNLDPLTLQQVDDWDLEKPRKPCGRTNSWTARIVAPHKSIWAPDYQPQRLLMERPDPCNVKRKSTSGRMVEHSVNIPALPVKRPVPNSEVELNALCSQFGSSPRPSKKPRMEDEDAIQVLNEIDQAPPKSESFHQKLVESPVKTQVNPFSKANPTRNKFSGLSKLAQFRRTSVDNVNLIQSRYFGLSSLQPVNKSVDEKSKTENTLQDLSNIVATNNKTVSESPFTNPKIERLSDSDINSIIEDLEKGSKVVKDSDIKTSSGKENSSGEQLLVKRENNFRWKPTLAEMYSFRSNPLPSSCVLNKKSTNASPNQFNNQNDCSERKYNTEGNHSRRNPFVKVVKVEKNNESSCLQSFPFKDVQLDMLTPESTYLEDSVISPPKITPKPQIKVGLSKKVNNSSCQKSLLTMFAFKPKPKLQK